MFPARYSNFLPLIAAARRAIRNNLGRGIASMTGIC